MKLKKLLPLLVVLLVVGCAHRAGTKVPVTPYEQVMVTNAMLANANNGVARSVINVNQAGLLSNDITAVVLTHQAKAAAIDLRLTNILSQGPAVASGKADDINALIGQIRAEGDAMVASGNLEIKDPTTQVSIKNSIDGVTSLAQTLLLNLRSAGVLK